MDTENEEVVLETPEEELEVEETDQLEPEPEDEETEDSEEEDSEEEEEEELLTIGDVEEEEPEDSSTIRHIRKVAREKDKEVRRLKKELEQLSRGPEENKPSDPGAKPKITDFEYDSDRYTAELDRWYERKQAYAVAQEKELMAQREFEKKIDSRKKVYVQQMHEFPPEVAQEAESTVVSMLSETNQNLILQYAKDPGKFVVALANTPKLLEELSKVEDTAEFAVKLGELQTKMTSKKKSRRAKTLPEKTIKGSKPVSAENTLERLRAEADRTNDRTKVVKYLRELRERGD